MKKNRYSSSLLISNILNTFDTSYNFRPLDSVTTALPTNKEVTGSIFGTAVGLLSNVELFRGMYGLVVFVVQYYLLCPVLSSEGVPALCWPQVRGGPPIMSVLLKMVHTNKKQTWKWYKEKLKKMNDNNTYNY
jgi:hypothetical protein